MPVRTPVGLTRSRSCGATRWGVGWAGFGRRALPVLVALGLLLVAGLAVASSAACSTSGPLSPLRESHLVAAVGQPGAAERQVRRSPQVRPSRSAHRRPRPAQRRSCCSEPQTNLGCDSHWRWPRLATRPSFHIDPESDVVSGGQQPILGRHQGEGERRRLGRGRHAERWRTPSQSERGWPSTGPPHSRRWVGTTPVIRGPRGEEVARDGTRMDREFSLEAATAAATQGTSSTSSITSRGRPARPAAARPVDGSSDEYPADAAGA